MNLDDVTIIIPTYNMADYIQPLWLSIVDCGILSLGAKVIFVDDGSTDRTRDKLESIKKNDPFAQSSVSILALKKNHGRFNARYQGAFHSKTSELLFLDTRIKLPVNFGERVKKSILDHNFVVGFVDININKSIYSLYWDRSHRFIFNRHFKIAENPVLLTPINYEKYLKGTGILLVPRNFFLKQCVRFIDDPPFSDDTFMLKEMVQEIPLMIHPELRCEWEPRQKLLPFLHRLFERGPSFAEYHIFRVRGNFFWIVASTALLMLVWFVFLLIHPTSALFVALAVAALATLTVFPMAKSPSEGIRLSGLHFLVILSFGFGVLYGIYKNLRKAITHSTSAR